MSSNPKVLAMIPETPGTGKGSVVAIYPQDAHPFGMKFLESVSSAMAGTGTTTTKTVSVTGGPDVDTDPEDSDSD